ARLPSHGGYAAGLEQGWLAVAAVDSRRPSKLATYSNACGIAMHYCLVAPGDLLLSEPDDDVGPSYRVVSGTSSAAPQVAGATALVWEKFPYFSNDLVRQTLLGNALDLWETGPDAVFGYGLLDVEK